MKTSPSWFIDTANQLFNPAETGFSMTRILSNRLGKELVRRYRNLTNLGGTALFALGGFGRREMCPASDVDIMILIPDSFDKNQLEEPVRHLLESLWADGLKVGHSVRTLQECESLLKTDVKTLTSLLDGRFLDGDLELSAAFDRLINGYLQTNKSLLPLYELIQFFNQRLEKSGGSVNLLEPNIKNSTGGLRDIHTLQWAFLLISEGDLLFESRSDDDETQTERLLLKLYKLGLIDETQYRHVYEASDFLLKTRFALHLVDPKAADQLGFHQQDKVAGKLGYFGDTAQNLSEIVMKRFYRHARKILRLSRTFILRSEDYIHPVMTGAVQALDGGFFIRNNRIMWGKDSQHRSIITGLQKSPHLLMMAFYYQALHGIRFSDKLRGAFAQSYDVITDAFQANPRVIHLFRKILTARHTSLALKNMLELGILNRFVPEYGTLVGLYQRNAYHWYTADYHTLVAIEYFENSREIFPPVHQVAESIGNKEIVVLSILFHDIGKGFDIKNHSIVGRDVAEQVMTRWEYTKEEIELVQFMVEHHLIMEQTAFRRNYHDPATLDEFAARFPSVKYLDILFCLTYADLSAVNPNVWTEWKGMMLKELHQLTRTLILSESNLASNEYLGSEKNNRQQLLSTHQTDPNVLAHIKEFDRHTDYWLTFRPEEVLEHVKRRFSKDDVDCMVQAFDGYYEITVFCEDQPGLLAKLCGVINTLDFSIFDARVFTSEDGRVIDRFRVFPLIELESPVHTIRDSMNIRLVEVLKNGQNISNLVRQNRQKWRRRFKPTAVFKPEVTFEETPEFMIFDVFAPDILGLLYTITHTFSENAITINHAKISTRVDGVNDAFYVKKDQFEDIGKLEEFTILLTESIETYIHETVMI